MSYGAGIHEFVDIDLYHSQRCLPSVSISSSGLRVISSECPARFFATSELNPNRMPVKKKASLDFGRAAHALMLGEPEFNSKFVISPYETFTTNNAKAWRDAQTKQVVKVADMELIQEMCRALKKSPQVSRAFDKGKPEMSVFWLHRPTGIWLKTRPDWLPDKPEKEFVVEYKTCATIDPRYLPAAVFKFGYHMQAAMFIDGLKEAAGIDAFGVAHACQEKDAPPYLAELRMFSNEQIDFGRRAYQRALAIFAECLNTGKWPGYTSEPQFFETPWNVQKVMEDEINDGNEDTAAA
jgi:hypothetical protein